MKNAAISFKLSDLIASPASPAARLIQLIALLSGIVNIWYQILFWIPSNWHRIDHDRDMAIYYEAAMRMHSGQPVYHTLTNVDGPWRTPQWYLYPPYLAASLTPFCGHYTLFCHVWYSLLIAAYWTFAYFLARVSVGRPSLTGTVVWGLVIALTPGAYRDMSLGNVDAMLWALFAGAMFLGGNQTLLMLMSLVKPYAIVPWLVYAVRRGKMRSTGSSVLLLAVATAAAIAVGGMGAFETWVTRATPLVGQGTFDPANWSLSFLPLRVAHGLHLWRYHDGPLGRWPRAYLTLMSIAGPAAAVYFTRRMSADARAVTLFLVTMLFAPLCWGMYLIYAYVPIAVLLRDATSSTPGRLREGEGVG